MIIAINIVVKGCCRDYGYLYTGSDAAALIYAAGRELQVRPCAARNRLS